MPKKKSTAAELRALFDSMTEAEKNEFIKSIPFQYILKNESFCEYQSKQERWERFLEDELTHTKREALELINESVPRRIGNPRRNWIIGTLADKGLTAGQIVREPDVVAANGGTRMTKNAVKQVLKRRRKRKGGAIPE